MRIPAPLPALLLALGLPGAGCSRSAIEDGAVLGPLTQIKGGFVSSFLGEAALGQVVLLDTGSDEDALDILDALADRGLGRQAVTAILLTHGHRDHTRGVAAFEGAPIYALAAEADTIAAESEETVTITDPLEDGAILSLGGWSIEVFAVPGHTPGSAAYLLEGVLVLGDVLMAHKDGTVSGPPRSFSDDPEQNDASVRTLAERLSPRSAEIVWLAFSHSGPLEGFAPLEGF